jgi:hypothetical protein
MMQRFGAVFGLAVVTAVFAADGGLGNPAAVANGFRPAVAVASAFAILAALAALLIGGNRREQTSSLDIVPVSS